MSEPNRLAGALGALSVATDLGAGLVEGTAMRTAVLAVRVGRRIGLDAEALRNVYYGAVLRFIGCTANSTEIAAMSLGEDNQLLHALGMCDWTDQVALRQALDLYFTPGASEEKRQECIDAICAGYEGIPSATVPHCSQAMLLISRMPVPDRVVDVIRHIYSRWDDAIPGPCGTEVSIETRIVAVAAGAELSRAVGGVPYVVEMAEQRCGSQFDPDLCRLIGTHADELFHDYDTLSHWDLFLGEEPESHLEISGHQRVRVAECFADYIDQKSGWFHGHSRQVASLSLRVAAALGIEQADRDRVYLAGLLHDIGRSAIPNRVWDKPGPLNPAERREAERHSLYTATILADAEIFSDVAEYSESVHERLDSSGYHRRGRLESKGAACVAAADMYTALVHARPWRQAMSSDDACELLSSEVREGRLPSQVIQALIREVGAHTGRSCVLPADLTPREGEILGCLILGMSNKEIGATLGISPKTAENHLTRVYEKTGTAGRAQAALFAVKHGIFSE